MKLQCYMPVLNEADILPWSIMAMLKQGVHVHCIDGWSTDHSWEIIGQEIWEASGLTVTRERFPEDQAADQQVCRQILARIEDLATASDADWIIYSDADEIRRSKRRMETLDNAIARIDARGYNAIDHDVFEFAPVDEGWDGTQNPEAYFQYYTRAEIICRLPNQKIWKNVGRVHLAGGGHSVEFSGKRLAPEKFDLKHYGYRSSAHGRRKVATRLQRRCHEEHRDGWGVHYDSIIKQEVFVRNAGRLQRWPTM